MIKKFMERILIMILVGLLPGTLLSQTIKNLVFEGGGVRGISYAGAIGELERLGLLKDIEKVGGTSVGAITALTLSLGYTAKEIESIIGDTNPGKFNDGNFLLFGGPSRLRKHYGWYKGNKFLRWTEKLIEKKTGNGDITFMEHHMKNYRDLYVTGTSLNNQKVIVFSYETYPNMKVKDAIRISMSTPFFFQAVFIDSVGQVLPKRKAKVDYDIMVDGGFITNFPIHLFDTKDSINNRIANPNTLGFRMDSKDQLEYDKQGKGLAPVPVHSVVNFISAFFNFIMENMNRAELTPEDWARTVSISAERVGAKVKKVSPEDRKRLIENGRTAMLHYWEQKQRMN
jgi:NTE family protein